MMKERGLIGMKGGGLCEMVEISQENRGIMLDTQAEI
jgi:hypothetical protein